MAQLAPLDRIDPPDSLPEVFTNRPLDQYFIALILWAIITVFWGIIGAGVQSLSSHTFELLSPWTIGGGLLGFFSCAYSPDPFFFLPRTNLIPKKRSRLS